MPLWLEVVIQGGMTLGAGVLTAGLCRILYGIPDVAALGAGVVAVVLVGGAFAAGHHLRRTRAHSSAQGVCPIPTRHTLRDLLWSGALGLAATAFGCGAALLLYAGQLALAGTLMGGAIGAGVLTYRAIRRAWRRDDPQQAGPSV